MKTRIGLFTPKDRNYKKNGMTTDASYVDVESVSDLVSALGGLGAKRVGLFYRDRVGAGHLEGELFAVTEVSDQHIAWVGEKTPEFQNRGLFYEKG